MRSRGFSLHIFTLGFLHRGAHRRRSEVYWRVQIGFSFDFLFFGFVFKHLFRFCLSRVCVFRNLRLHCRSLRDHLWWRSYVLSHLRLLDRLFDRVRLEFNGVHYRYELLLLKYNRSFNFEYLLRWIFKFERNRFWFNWLLLISCLFCFLFLLPNYFVHKHASKRLHFTHQIALILILLPSLLSILLVLILLSCLYRISSL